MGPAMYGAELLDGRTWYTMLPYIICAWSPSFWASLAINQFIVTATKNNICTLMSESVELYCTRYADVVKNYQRELFQCCRMSSAIVSITTAPKHFYLFQPTVTNTDFKRVSNQSPT